MYDHYKRPAHRNLMAIQHLCAITLLSAFARTRGDNHQMRVVSIPLPQNGSGMAWNGLTLAPVTNKLYGEPRTADSVLVFDPYVIPVLN